MSESPPQPLKRPLSHPPYVLALVIADWIHHDPGTGKITILGLFSVVQSTKFPTTLPVLAVYLAFTDGNGTVPVTLRLVDVDDEREPIIEMQTTVDFPDPRMIVEANLIAKNVTFPKPGEYRLQMHGCGELLIERRIAVVAIDSSPGSETEQEEVPDA